MESQLLLMSFERMVRNNSLPKLTAAADEIGMPHAEFHSKISINPRTPITFEERVQFEHVIAAKDKDEFRRYMENFHCMIFEE